MSATSTSFSPSDCWSDHISSCDSSSHEGATLRSTCGISSYRSCTSEPTTANLVRSHRLANEEQGEAWTPSECCSQTASVHPQAACQRKSNVADLEVFPL